MPVACRQVEHENEVRVFEDVLHLPAGEKILHILGDAGGNAAPFAEALPDLSGIRRGLLFPEQQMHFVDIVAGAAS